MYRYAFIDIHANTYIHIKKRIYTSAENRFFFQSAGSEQRNVYVSMYLCIRISVYLCHVMSVCVVLCYVMLGCMCIYIYEYTDIDIYI